jgi:ectoine hydroxylase-related dioxygenase (phytanoyl-CoA dioxygenase family)
VLTDEDRSTFWGLGYLRLGRVSEAARAVALKHELAAVLGGDDHTIPAGHLMRADTADRHVRVVLHLCHINAMFCCHAMEPAVVEAVADLFDERPLVLTSLLFAKPPGVGQPLTAHQDLPYYPYLAQDDLITSWMALDAVGRENGAIEYVAGSHHQLVPHRETQGQQALDIDPETWSAAFDPPVCLQSGEAVVHHGLTVHRSGANTSLSPRLGLATLYVRPAVAGRAADLAYPLLDPDQGTPG